MFASANLSRFFGLPLSLTVTPAPLVVTADNKTMVYGTALPALTATSSGLVNGETAGNLTQPVALTTTATASSPAGSYPITVTGGASPNYTLTLREGVLTIQLPKKPESRPRRIEVRTT